jgi:dTDP-4-dehydrorhamnose 3,5-epimerase
VAVDLRKSSPTYLKWFGIELTPKNHKMLLIPQGFAHGFITLLKNSEVQYKVDNFYDPKTDRSIKYNDPDIGINWPSGDYILSDKDKNAPFLIDSDVNFI